EIPLAEGLEHTLVLRALDELRDGQSFQRGLAITALGDEHNLRPVASHARWKGLKLARASRTAGTGFFEFAGDFPRGFVRRCRAGGKVQGADDAHNHNRRESFSGDASFHKLCSFIETPVSEWRLFRPMA